MKAFLRGLFRVSYRLRVSYLRSRYELPFVLNAMNLTGEGAEVGVQHGNFSAAILDSWHGERLYSVDPWREFPSADYVDVSNVSQEQQDGICREAMAKLAPFGLRSEVLRMTSEVAASQFGRGQLDFVYIDAQHHYEAAKEDIWIWLPKVRRGGLLAGHDYVDGARESGLYGVKRAVDEFAASTGARLVVSAEKDWPSWFLFL